jgi:hypothetical protein
MDSRGLGSEIELLPNADTAWFVGCRRSVPPSAARATAEPPKGQLTTLAAGQSQPSRISWCDGLSSSVRAADAAFAR